MNLFRIKTIDEIKNSADVEQHKLSRVLGAKDVVFLGIGAIVGAGIFTSIGAAAGKAGPAVVVSYALIAVVCALAGLCYAELTAMIPVSGSAYTYAFATMGEFIAWIIGWDLILEYAIGNVAVAISWSGYFQSLLSAFHVTLPDWLAFGVGDVHERIATFTKAVAAANQDLASAVTDIAPDKLEALKAALSDATSNLATWQHRLDAAPHVMGHPILVNIPAVLIVMLITWLLVRGVKESARANTIMVVIKLGVLALFVAVGIAHFDASNWKDFSPHGWGGIRDAAGAVFFAYIGFDAVSTAAEETKNPKRDMPIGILGSLAICTVIYILVAAVATGMTPYNRLAEGADPLANALKGAHLPAIELIVSLGAVISMSAVLLVFQLGQPRIFFAMSRDGLLPETFARVHPIYRTPHVTTIITGLVVAIASAVIDDDATFDLTSIGTLFAFVIACAGVLVLRITKPDQHRPFRVPGVWIVAPLAIASCLYTMYGLGVDAWLRFGIWLAIGLVIYFARGMMVPRRN